MKNRVIYGGLLIGALYLCYQYQNPVTSMFAYTLLILPAIALLHLLVIYKSFTYTQEIDKKFITKGESIHFTCTVSNESKFFYPDLEINFYGHDSIFNAYFKRKKVSVPPCCKKDYPFPLVCPYRGYYAVGIKKVYITDFLGLVRVPYNVFNPLYITVYPRIIPLKHFHIERNVMEKSEQMLSKQIGESAIMSDIRQYAYGDSMRKIHWKLTAKRQELMVKNYDAMSSTGNVILLDLNKGIYDIMTNTIIEDKAIECTVAILYYCLQQEFATQLSYYNQSFIQHSAENMRDFEGLYQILFKIKFDATISIDQVFHLRQIQLAQSGNVILVTALLTYALYEEVYRLILENHTVSIIYISPSELIEKEDKAIPIIIEAFSQLAVNFYKIEISDDIKMVLEA